MLRWSNSAPYEFKVLDSALVNFVHYAAIEKTNTATGERKVFATVILIKSFREDRKGHNFCWKDLSEDMEPVDAECPTRILDLLTPTDNEGANNWRQRCRRHAAIVASVPKIKAGMTLRFSKPLRFTAGSIDTLVVREVRRGGAAICSSPELPGLYKLKRSDLICRAGGFTVEP